MKHISSIVIIVRQIKFVPSKKYIAKSTLRKTELDIFTHLAEFFWNVLYVRRLYGNEIFVKRLFDVLLRVIRFAVRLVVLLVDPSVVFKAWMSMDQNQNTSFNAGGSRDRTTTDGDNKTTTMTVTMTTTMTTTMMTTMMMTMMTTMMI